jgi:hypothetical protein
MEKIIEKSNDDLAYDWKGELIAILIAVIITIVFVITGIYWINIQLNG